MSTTRHRRHSRQQIGARAATGVVLGADAAWTIHADNGVYVLATLALAVTGTALVATALSWIASAVWHRGRGRYLAKTIANTPLRRPLYPIGIEHQDRPRTEVPLQYSINADHWRQDGPPDPDAIKGPRPYMPPVPPRAATNVGSAQ